MTRASSMYREWAPPESLAPYVECFWTSTGTRESGSPTHVLPDGCADVVFELVGQPCARVVGTMTRALRLDPQGPTRFVGARFRPGAAPSFLGLSMKELVDRSVPFEELDPGAEELTAGLVRTEDEAQAVGLLARALRVRLACADPLDALVQEAASRIDAARGDVRVGTLARHLRVSRQHLTRRFGERVGVGPKMHARIVRMRHAMERAERAPRRSWAEIAFDLGYADQAHLVTEFRDLAGTTPTRWRAGSP